MPATARVSAAPSGIALITNFRLASTAFSASVMKLSVSLIFFAPASSTNATVKFGEVPPLLLPSRFTTGGVFR